MTNDAVRGMRWPALKYAGWKDTYATLHMWTQIVGKIRAAHTPWVNHSWHVALYVTARGLGTSPIACGARSFELDFDFIEHRLTIAASDGAMAAMPLQACSVADFYRDLLARLNGLGIDVHIDKHPNEVIEAIAFDVDRLHASYDALSVNRFWRALAQADRLLKRFRAGFIGKCSPVHFFWGSFDLAVSRFSGRRAPEHPGGIANCPDWVTREAYSHELCSCGFWPGRADYPEALFYCYAYPEPPGFGATPAPPGSRYDRDLREFVLPYDAVRAAADPDALVLAFLQGTYEAAATLGQWDRTALERSIHELNAEPNAQLFDQTHRPFVPLT
jgi:hypothetical protein